MNGSVTTIILVVVVACCNSYAHGKVRDFNGGINGTIRRDDKDRQLQGASTPAFLFAGQSNMEGHPMMAACEFTKATKKGRCVSGELEVEVNEDFTKNVTNDDIQGQNLNRIVEIIQEELPYQEAMTKLKQHILRIMDPAINADHSRAWWQAANMLSTKSNYPSFFDTIEEDLDDVYCSWTRTNGGQSVVLAESKVLSASSGCGAPFGPELAFSHTLETFDEFGIAKVAEGGTTLRHEWNMDEPGRCWEAFAEQMGNIAGAHRNCPLDGSGSCKWHGLVWFQGENDMFLDEEDARAYGDELQRFIEEARREMFPEAAPIFQTPEDIPVVIVQLGCWPTGFFLGQLIMEAERAFVDQDSNSALVKTNDLSCFYHYDVSSHLIIGERIAKAMDGLLASSFHETFDRTTKDCQSKSALCYDDSDCCGSCDAYHRCQSK